MAGEAPQPAPGVVAVACIDASAGLGLSEAIRRLGIPRRDPSNAYGAAGLKRRAFHGAFGVGPGAAAVPGGEARGRDLKRPRQVEMAGAVGVGRGHDLVVRRVPQHMSMGELQRYFTQFGPVLHVRKQQGSGPNDPNMKIVVCFAEARSKDGVREHFRRQNEKNRGDPPPARAPGAPGPVSQTPETPGTPPGAPPSQNGMAHGQGEAEQEAAQDQNAEQGEMAAAPRPTMRQEDVIDARTAVIDLKGADFCTPPPSQGFPWPPRQDDAEVEPVREPVREPARPAPAGYGVRTAPSSRAAREHSPRKATAKYEVLLTRIQKLIEEQRGVHNVDRDALVRLLQRDELRKILRANNVSYHRHGNRRANQMMSKTEMADQLHGIIRSQFPPYYGLARQDETEGTLSRSITKATALARSMGRTISPQEHAAPAPARASPPHAESSYVAVRSGPQGPMLQGSAPPQIKADPPPDVEAAPQAGPGGAAGGGQSDDAEAMAAMYALASMPQVCL